MLRRCSGRYARYTSKDWVDWRKVLDEGSASERGGSPSYLGGSASGRDGTDKLGDSVQRDLVKLEQRGYRQNEKDLVK